MGQRDGLMLRDVFYGIGNPEGFHQKKQNEKEISDYYEFSFEVAAGSSDNMDVILILTSTNWIQ